MVNAIEAYTKKLVRVDLFAEEQVCADQITCIIISLTFLTWTFWLCEFQAVFWHFFLLVFGFFGLNTDLLFSVFKILSFRLMFFWQCFRLPSDARAVPLIKYSSLLLPLVLNIDLINHPLLIDKNFRVQGLTNTLTRIPDILPVWD